MPELGALLLAMKIAVTAMLALAAFGVTRRVQLWRQGRAAAIDWVAGLAALPRRYLRDVHAVVARDPISSRMHALTAGGFLACGAAFLVDLVLGRPAGGQWIGLAAALIMLAGVALAIRRRQPSRRPHRASFSGGEWSRFVVALAALAGGLVLWFVAPRGTSEAPILLMAASALLLASGLEVGLGFAMGGPLRHAWAGAMNLAFHPRPDRFAERAQPSVGLAPLDLTGPLGPTQAADLPWNRILNVDACVQCGRCEAACPAFAAGQPLNPKAFIYDVAQASGLPMAPYSGHGHPVCGTDVAGPRALGTVTPDTLWSCTTCRACVQSCPMMIEHVDLMIDLRRHEVLERGALPGTSPVVLAALRDTDSQSGGLPEERFHWTTDLPLRVLGEGEACDVLWIVGEAGFQPRARRTLRAVAALLAAAGVDVSVLGPAEGDCGDLARRLGEDSLAQDLASRLIATLATRRFQRIITTDPHVLNALRNDFPAQGGHYRVDHHTTILAEMVEAGRLSPNQGEMGRVTIHDPCYLGRYNGEFAPIRTLVDRATSGRIEMERSGPSSRCCGGGGGAPLADIPGRTRIPDIRMADVIEAGARTVVVGCPNCAVMLEGVAGAPAAVVDAAELLADAVPGLRGWRT